MQSVVKVGDMAFDVKSIASMHWEGSKLFVHLVGGRFLQLLGEQAKTLWQFFVSEAVDLV